MNSPVYGDIILIDKDNLRKHRQVVEPIPDAVQAGQILIKLDSFGLSANNITYGLIGREFEYWDYFPANNPQDGVLPVWGHATVIRSRHAEIRVGETLYGYFPMASHLVMQPGSFGETTFVDEIEHRRALHITYNTYERLHLDPIHDNGRQEYRESLIPLFGTAFVADDFLDVNSFYSASRVIFIGASSKTSVGLAFLVNRRPDIHTVGLTSERNRKFVGSLGFYDTVHSYDALDEITVGEPTICVDVSGNGELVSRLHHKLGDSLKYSCLIGRSHWDQDMVSRDDVPGPRPKLLWAPGHSVRRRSELGADVFSGMYRQAWSDFMSVAPRHYAICRHSGVSNIETLYREMVAGAMNPSKMDICAW